MLGRTIMLVLAAALAACGGVRPAPSAAASAAGTSTTKSCAEGIEIGDPTIRGSLARRSVERELRRARGRIRRCLANEPGPVALTVRVVVAASGDPSAASVQSGQLHGEGARECLVRALEGMRFPST